MVKNDKMILSPEDIVYLMHMLNEYEVLVEKEPNAGAESLIKNIKERMDGSNGRLTVNDIYALELALIALKPIGLLRSEATFLRARYAAFVGSETYAEYERTSPPYLSPHDAQTNERDRQLRTDMQTLLTQMHQYLNFTAAREQERHILLTTLMWMSVVLCVLGSGFVLGCVILQRVYPSRFSLEGTAVFCLVICAGVLGGFVSTQQRLQTTTHQGDSMVNLIELRNGKLSIWLAPLSGGIFAVLLYHLFIGSLLQGALFPVMAKDKPIGFSLLQLSNTLPESMSEFAKLMIWSFLAGFAERLVPDTLQRIVASAPKTETAGRGIASVAPVSAGDAGKAPEETNLADKPDKEDRALAVVGTK